MDLVFLDPEQAWQVVDFKTDQQITPHLDEYRAQVRLYMEAVSRATGARTGGALFWV